MQLAAANWELFAANLAVCRTNSLSAAAPQLGFSPIPVTGAVPIACSPVYGVKVLPPIPATLPLACAGT